MLNGRASFQLLAKPTGACPKDRFTRTPEGEPNLNYLCAGYKAFFEHVDPPMRRMAALIRAGRRASEFMTESALRSEPARRAALEGGPEARQ